MAEMSGMTASARARAIEPFPVMAALEQVRKLEATSRENIYLEIG